MMASDREIYLATLDLGECLLCQEVIREPSTLSCLHTVCIQCLTVNNNNNSNNNNCANNKQDKATECPLCSRIFLMPSDGITNVTNNFFMNQLLESNKPTGLPILKKTSLCEVCSGDEIEILSTSFCIECDQHICDRCSEMHCRIKALISHEVVQDKDISAKESLKPTASYCDQHPSDEKRLYCYDCKMLMCHKCVARPNRHSLAEAKELQKKFFEILKMNIVKVSEYSSQKQDQLIQLLTVKKSFLESIESTRSDIQCEYEKLSALVETYKSHLMKELNACRDKVLKEFETKRADIENECVITENFRRYCLGMMNKGIACDMSRVTDDLHARAEELLKTEDKRDGLKLTDVKIMFKPSLSNTDTMNNFIGELIFAEPQRREQKMDLSIFLNDPKLLHVDDNEKRPITGVTVLGGAFFVIRQSSLVYVYSCDSFRLIRQLNIAGAKYLRGIVSCVHFNCLYVCDPGSKTIYKYDVTSYDISNWSTKLNCEALSVNKTDHNVLATSPDSCNTRRILVYTTHGCLVREIYLDESIVAVRHCVQLSTGNYVVSHSGSTRRQIHRVCIVDDYGRVVRSIGGRSGSGVGQLSDPRHLAVDAYDNILVADFSNNRLQLLSPNLVDLGCLKIPGYRLHDPYTICLDEPNRRLYVGEWGEGRVFVLDAGIDVGNN